jgi:hypothetical protein
MTICPVCSLQPFFQLLHDVSVQRPNWRTDAKSAVQRDHQALGSRHASHTTLRTHFTFRVAMLPPRQPKPPPPRPPEAATTAPGRIARTPTHGYAATREAAMAAFAKSWRRE